ncbi:MAG TPA: hypothetical protein VE466_11295 [Acidimicrobiales bacterium]|nr:hypothetical protein [Acidimicrobiales bacterium]
MEALSDGKGEFGEDHREPAAGLGIEAEFVVSATQVLDDRDARYRPRPPTTPHREEPLIMPFERRRHNPPAALDYQLVCSLVDPNLVTAVSMLATVER